jgi:hypothetical protein
MKPLDVQDKLAWCKWAEPVEAQICEYCQDHGIDLRINPEKKENKYAVDCLYNGELADIKNHETPFFFADRYGVNPSYAFMFGYKDVNRYTELYPDIGIIVVYNPHILTMMIGGSTKRVQHFGGIFYLPFKEVAMMCHPSNMHQHKYRVNDTKGNDKANYVLDIRNFKELIRFNKILLFGE